MNKIMIIHTRNEKGRQFASTSCRWPLSPPCRRGTIPIVGANIDSAWWSSSSQASPLAASDGLGHCPTSSLSSSSSRRRTRPRRAGVSALHALASRPLMTSQQGRQAQQGPQACVGRPRRTQISRPEPRLRPTVGESLRTKQRGRRPSLTV